MGWPLPKVSCATSLATMQLNTDFAKLNMDADGNIAMLPGRTAQMGKVRPTPAVLLYRCVMLHTVCTAVTELP